MSDLSFLEAALLQIVSEGNGEYSWYNIEIRLSNMDVPRDPGAMTVLKDLVKRGMLRRHMIPGSSGDKWEITDLGLTVLHEHGG